MLSLPHDSNPCGCAWRRPFPMGVALLGWLALALQLFLVVRNAVINGSSTFDALVNTLSYFTVLTNLLVVVVLTAYTVHGEANTFMTSAGTKAAAAVYICVVGVVYSLVLRSTWDPTGLQKAADIALHDLMPVLYVVLWLGWVPKGVLRWTQPLYWLAYPAAYFAYSLVRGTLTGRYLYPFADVSALGYLIVIRNAVLLLAAFLVLGLIAVAVDRWMGAARAR
jgi:hypothetical protein